MRREVPLLYLENIVVVYMSGEAFDSGCIGSKSVHATCEGLDVRTYVRALVLGEEDRHSIHNLHSVVKQLQM